MVTNSDVKEPPDKPTSESELSDKATSDRNLKSRLRARLQFIGGALASFAAVSAIAGGLVGYWNFWKTVRTDVLPDRQKTQSEARARPDIVPRLSLVVLFANLNNDPEQDYFAEGIATHMPLPELIATLKKKAKIVIRADRPPPAGVDSGSASLFYEITL